MRRGLDQTRRLSLPWQIALRQHLGSVVEHAVDLGQRGIAFRRQVRGATRYDDARIGMPTTRAADRLACLAFGLGSDCARVADARAGQPGPCGGTAAHVGFEPVAPSSESAALILTRQNAKDAKRSAANAP